MYNKAYYGHFIFGTSKYKNSILNSIKTPFDHEYNMTEIYEKTHKIAIGDLFMGLMKYNAGYCQYNYKKSKNIELNDHENKIYNSIKGAYDKVEPLSYPINLFHGFEKDMKYPKFEKNKTINFDFILSKTPSWHVANFFARATGWINRYMYVIYPPNTKHLSIDVRLKNNNEYEYLAMNEKLTYKDKIFHITLLPFSINIYYVFEY